MALIEKVEALGARYGIGRGIHLGDTIIGTKGRVAFEAPAAEILISAHRELEKLDVARHASAHQGAREPEYGQFIHEGKQLDPACRDIEALLSSSQERVTGKVRVQLRPGSLFVLGVTSPHSLMAGQPRQVRRSGRRMDAGGRARLLEDHGVARDVPHPGRRGSEMRCAVFVDKIASVARRRTSAKRSA